MLSIVIGVLVAFQTSPAATQPVRLVELKPSTDSAEQRKGLRNLSACLAKARPRWARETLSHPYLSTAQASIAAQALAGRDSCVRGAEVDVTFRTSTLVGSLAEHFIAAGTPSATLNELTGALATITPLNPSEDFALCVAVRDPATARTLALSDPGSETEAKAAAKLTRAIGPCISSGEKPAVELQSLRALVSVALYRGMESAAKS